MLECRTVYFCVKAYPYLPYFIPVCFYFIFFIFHYTYLLLWSSFVYLFRFSTTLKYSFNTTCKFLSWSVSALLLRGFVQLCMLNFLSLWNVFLLFQFFSSIFLLCIFLFCCWQYTWFFLGFTSWFCCFFFNDFTEITCCDLKVFMSVFIKINFKSLFHALELLCVGIESFFFFFF